MRLKSSMTTLTEVSYYTRKFLPFGILAFIILFIMFYAVKLLFMTLFGFRGPQKVYTNTVFGKIKKPQVKVASPPAGLKFTLDTIEGRPVTATQAAKVYFLPPQAARFGYREKIYLVAKTLGFDTALIKHKLIDTEASFVDSKQKLAIDITNFNFQYQYSFEKDPAVFTKTVIPSKNEIENKAINFLKTVGRYPEELSKGKTNIIYLRYNPQTKGFTFFPRPTADVNAAEVDFYRPDVDGLSSVSPSYFNSQHFVIMTFYDSGTFKVLKAQIKFFEKSEEQVGTYPVKSGETAWQELQAGGGMIISFPGQKSEVTIKNMFMGYLDPDFYQDYLQPVYVFLGESNFVAYVSAVDNSYFTE